MHTHAPHHSNPHPRVGCPRGNVAKDVACGERETRARQYPADLTTFPGREPFSFPDPFCRQTPLYSPILRAPSPPTPPANSLPPTPPASSLPPPTPRVPVSWLLTKEAELREPRARDAGSVPVSPFPSRASVVSAAQPLAPKSAGRDVSRLLERLRVVSAGNAPSVFQAVGTAPVKELPPSSSSVSPVSAVRPPVSVPVAPAPVRSTMVTVPDELQLTPLPVPQAQGSVVELVQYPNAAMSAALVMAALKASSATAWSLDAGGGGGPVEGEAAGGGGEPSAGGGGASAAAGGGWGEGDAEGLGEGAAGEGESGGGGEGAVEGEGAVAATAFGGGGD